MTHFSEKQWRLRRFDSLLWKTAEVAEVSPFSAKQRSLQRLYLRQQRLYLCQRRLYLRQRRFDPLLWKIFIHSLLWKTAEVADSLLWKTAEV